MGRSSISSHRYANIVNMKNKIYYICMCLLTTVLNIIMTLLSLLIPKTRSYVIVGGWNGLRYADNSRAMYEYLNTHKSELKIKRVFWYTKDKQIYDDLNNQGLDVLFGMNIRSVYWHFRSKIHIVDQYPQDIIDFLSVRCIRINLFHGVGLKKIYNFMREKPTFCNILNKMDSRGFWRDQFILTTSETEKAICSYAFGLKEKKCIKASYPRNRYLYVDTNRANREESFNIIYLPTFRNNQDSNPLLESDLNVINEKFKEKKIHLFIKAHFANKAKWDKQLELSNIIYLHSKFDIYEILHEMDLVITDYSSVYFDFMLTGRPILFYPYDLEYYKNQDRGFIIPYMENSPGEKVYTVKELIEKIFDIQSHYDFYINKYKLNYNIVRDMINEFVEKPNYSELLSFWKTKV